MCPSRPRVWLGFQLHLRRHRGVEAGRRAGSFSGGVLLCVCGIHNVSLALLGILGAWKQFLSTKIQLRREIACADAFTFLGA